MLKRQMQRSWRKIERKFAGVRSSTTNFFRSTSSYQERTTTSPTFQRAASESESDDAVFEAVEAEATPPATPDTDSQSSIPCEICQEPIAHDQLWAHQTVCEERSRVVRVRFQGSSNRRRAPDSDRSRPPRRPAPSAPVRERSPSPTEGVPVPANLSCPITLALFRDPVVASDGHTYEREAIVTIIQQTGRSPLTRDRLSIDRLNPNRVVKEMADEFREACKRKRDLYKYRLDADLQKAEVITSVSTKNKEVISITWLKHPPIHNAFLLHLTGDNALQLAEILSRIPLHPNLVRTYGRVENAAEEVLIVQECAPVQTLAELLAKHEEMLTLPLLDIIFYQIACALEHLGQSNVIFGDLTADDVLIYQMDSFIDKNYIKLANISNYLISEENGDGDGVAPEVKSARSYSKQSDVYSFGRLAHRAYSSKPHADERRELFDRCIATDPQARPTIDQITSEFKQWASDQGLLTYHNSSE